jgi:hypothetical protein
MLMKKFIGEPYAGKLHVRIDEGAGKGISPSRSTLLVKKTNMYNFFISLIDRFVSPDEFAL